MPGTQQVHLLSIPSRPTILPLAITNLTCSLTLLGTDPKHKVLPTMRPVCGLLSQDFPLWERSAMPWRGGTRPGQSEAFTHTPSGTTSTLRTDMWVKDDLTALSCAMLTGVLLRWSLSAPSSSESLPESWQLALAGATGSCARKACSTRRYPSRPSSERAPLWNSQGEQWIRLVWNTPGDRYHLSYAQRGVANQNLLKY